MLLYHYKKTEVWDLVNFSRKVSLEMVENMDFAIFAYSVLREILGAKFVVILQIALIFMNYSIVVLPINTFEEKKVLFASNVLK